MTREDFDNVALLVDPLKEGIEALGLGLAAVIIAYPADGGAKLAVLADPDCPQEVTNLITRRLNVKLCGTRGDKT